MGFFQERVRNSRGKRAISVRAQYWSSTVFIASVYNHHEHKTSLYTTNAI